MTNILWKAIVTALSLILILNILACGLHSTNTTTASIPVVAKKQNKWKLISKNPFLYERQIEKANDIKMYLTSVKECGRTNVELIPSIGRQLFVGFEQLQLIDQKLETIHKTPTLRSTAKAKLDQTPVLVTSYTQIRNGCSYDIITWFPNKAVFNSKIKQELTLLEKNLTNFMQ